MVAIGCSAGGMQALRRVLPHLDPGLPVPVVVVSHTGSEDVATLCELLESSSALPVREAVERTQATGGVVHVAPSGYHLLLEHDGRFALSVDERVTFARPSIDVFLEAAADAIGSGLVGVILTGANSDGAKGLRRVRLHGGIAIVQEPSEAQAAAMPIAALEMAGADHCLRLDDIPPLLNRLCLS